MTFVVFQALSAVLIGGVVFFPGTRKRNGRFALFGWIIWILGAVLFVTSTVIIQHRSTTTRIQIEYKLEEIREQLFTVLASSVMQTPRGPKIPPAQRPSERVKIAEPAERAKVDRTQEVKGRVRNRYDNVWVIVHPIGTSSYWVQPSISVKKDGTWTVTAYFGRSGDIDVGKKFEIMAVLNPKRELKEAEIFDKWPAAESRSDIVTVLRH